MTTAARDEGAAAASTARRWLLAALLLAAAYALPLYYPPATFSSAPPPPQAPLLARLFPGVPQWWVAGRLACLAGAIALVTIGLAARSSPFGVASFAGRAIAASRTIPKSWLLAVLGVAAAHAVASFAAADLGRVAQLGYVVLLFVPSALLLAANRHRVRDREGAAPGRRTSVLTTCAVIAAWIAWRGVSMWHSPRAADAVDGWDGLQCLAGAASPDFNLLTDGCYAGYTALPLVIQGAGILGWQLPLTFEAVQVVHLAWIAACAAGVAWAAAEILGAAAGPVAASVFLFAPFELMVPLWTAGSFVFPVYATALLVATLRARRTGSPAAIAAFGALAGIAMRCPPLVLIVALLAAWAVASPRVRAAPVAVLATAACSFWVAFGPSLQTALQIGHALTAYGRGTGSWQVMEAALFGQFSARSAEGAIGALRPHALDVPLGLAFAPFATARTAVRLWGDAILDPAGAALAAIGLAVALRAAARDNEARLLLMLLCAALLPGVVSSYDRPSLLRVATVAVPLSLLAAAGFEFLRRSLGSRCVAAGMASALACVAIAGSGTLLFDVVNPRILARSPVGIVLSELDSDRFAGAVVLEETHWKPRYTRASAEEVPARPLRVVPASGLEELMRAPSPPQIVFWSPGEEDEYAVSRTVCSAWPAATLYELRDHAGLTSVFAASHVPIPLRARRAHDCGKPLETQASRARAVLAQSRELMQGGRIDDAAALLEAQAARAYGYPELFDATARALLARPSGSDADAARASEWASRACSATKKQDPEFCSTVASAHAARGRAREAIRAARLARDAARARGDEAFARRMEQRIQEYARAAAERG